LDAGDTIDTPPPASTRAMPALTARACASRAASAIEPAVVAAGASAAAGSARV